MLVLLIVLIVGALASLALRRVRRSRRNWLTAGGVATGATLLLVVLIAVAASPGKTVGTCYSKDGQGPTVQVPCG